MAVAGSPVSGDALSKLRIERGGPPRGSRFGRIIRFVLLTALVTGVLGGVVFMASQRGWIPDVATVLSEAFRPVPEVRTTAVSLERGRSADALVVATGYVKSFRQARIGARATGRIQAVNVDEGTRVKRDDVLAVLEHADLDAALAAARATALRSRSELQEQDVEIERTLRDLERAEKAVAARTMTPADYDAARFQHQAAVARRVSLDAAHQLAEARVQEAEQLRENMFVRAPFDGTVISKDAELGESIMPGGMGEASGRGSVVTIADLEHLEVDCDVKEDFISRVTHGQQAEVAIDAVPGRRYKGVVRKIIPMGDRARATVKVRVEITDADERLFPEMSSTVYFLPGESEITTSEAESRVFCLTECIVQDGETRYVWQIGAENRLQRVNVTVGAVRDKRTEILSGLAGGERVVASPSREMKQNLKVKPVQ